MVRRQTITMVNPPPAVITDPDDANQLLDIAFAGGPMPNAAATHRVLRSNKRAKTEAYHQIHKATTNGTINVTTSAEKVGEQVVMHDATSDEGLAAVAEDSFAAIQNADTSNIVNPTNTINNNHARLTNAINNLNNTVNNLASAVNNLTNAINNLANAVNNLANAVNNLANAVNNLDDTFNNNNNNTAALRRGRSSRRAKKIAAEDHDIRPVPVTTKSAAAETAGMVVCVPQPQNNNFDILPVTNAAGLVPPNFPHTNRGLVNLTAPAIQTLLQFYGLPHAAPIATQRQRLRQHLGLQ
jgi:archaellum component FlaC